jgi:hypothetical protein
MSDPASGSSAFSGVGQFVEEHRTAAIVIGGVVFVFVMYEILKPSPAPVQQVATAPSDTASINAAGQIQSTQIAANSASALATIAAGVTNNQTAAAQTVALAQLQGQTDASVAAAAATTASAYYGAATSIAASNTAGLIAQTQAQRDEQIAGDSTIASEFSNLSNLLAKYGTTTQALVAGLNAGSPGSAPAVGVIPNLQGPVAPNTGEGLGLAMATGSAWLGIQDEMVQNQIALSTNNQINANNASLVALAAQENDANNAAANARFTSLTGTVNGAVSTMTGWLSSLFGAFNTTAANVKPATNAPSATTISQINAGLLAGGPTLPSAAGLSHF